MDRKPTGEPGRPEAPEHEAAHEAIQKSKGQPSKEGMRLKDKKRLTGTELPKEASAAKKTGEPKRVKKKQIKNDERGKTTIAGTTRRPTKKHTRRKQEVCQEDKRKLYKTIQTEKYVIIREYQHEN